MHPDGREGPSGAPFFFLKTHREGGERIPKERAPAKASQSTDVSYGESGWAHGKQQFPTMEGVRCIGPNKTHMTQQLAISKNIITMADLQQRFGIVPSQDDQFFREWSSHLTTLTPTETKALDQIKARFDHPRNQGAS